MKTVSTRFQIEKEMGWENPGPGIRRSRIPVCRFR